MAVIVDVYQDKRKESKESDVYAVLIELANVMTYEIQNGMLQPGETETMTFRLPAKELAFVGADGHWTIEEGDFEIKVAPLICPIVCTQTKRW